MAQTDARTIKTGTYGRFSVTRARLGNGDAGYLIAFAYDAGEVARIRRMAGAKWLAGNKAWFVPTTSDAHLAAYLAIETRTAA